MSSEDKNASLRKPRKINRFSLAFGILFGCASKKNLHDEDTDKEYASVSCQCQEEKELEAKCFNEEEQLLSKSKAKLDLTIFKENEIAPLAEEFRVSLNKLDTLINTLSDIHDIYKNNTPLEYCDEQSPLEDNIGNGETEEEHLKFNINFDKNTFIECHTNRGKQSLKIIHNSTQPNYNPLILHRCESEFLLIKKSHEINHHLINTYNSETYHEKSSQLQRSYHTLSSNFGGRVLNLTTFKSSFIGHVQNIKDDVQTLRHICSVDYITNKEDTPILPFSFGKINKVFLGNNKELEYNIREDKPLLIEEHRFVQAKLRASNFCKFYTLAKKLKEKGKEKKQVKL